MKQPSDSLERTITARQRDLWIVTSVVILAMSVGVAVLWPSVKAAVSDRFGDQFPVRMLLADFLVLVTFLIAYLWHKGHQVRGMVKRLVRQQGQNDGLKVQLETLQNILEASSLHDQSSAEYLNSLLRQVTQSLRADQCILYRTRQDRSLERDTSFPSQVQAPDPELLQFEDAVALRVAQSDQTLLIWEDTDPTELGVGAPRPEHGLDTVAAVPLLVDEKNAGVLLVRNAGGLIGAEFDDEALRYLQIFAGFASGVVRSLRAFQEMARGRADLQRAHQSLMERQRELSEVETVTALSRIAYTMAHGMSSPLTALSGYAELLREADPKSQESRAAHKGLSAEIVKLRDRMQWAIDFTSNYRSRYELTDLNSMVRETLLSCRTELQADAIVVGLQAYKDLPLTMVDVVRMRQVLLTLILYVKKSMSARQDVRKLRVRTLPHSGRIRVQFLFPGMADLVEAVQPLLRSNVEMDSMQRSQEGLSVAIASNIVRQHQGEVSVEMEGNEVQVNIEVPIRRDAPPPPKGVIAVSPNAAQPHRVEDVLDQILSFAEPEPQFTPRPAAERPAPARAPAARAEPTTAAAPAPAPAMSGGSAEQSVPPARPAAPAAATPSSGSAAMPPLPPGPDADAVASMFGLGEGSESAPTRTATAPARPQRGGAPRGRTSLPPIQASPGRADPQLAPATTPGSPGKTSPTRTAAAKEVANLDNLFGPGDLYRGPQETLAAPVRKQAPASKAGDPDAAPTTAPLLDGNEIEDALKLFDQVDG